jgi:DNA-binding transcriptional MerR regulator
MLFMPKLPKDIFERSKSTQIQWIAIIFIWTSAMLFIIVSGIVYIMNSFGIASFTFQDTIWIFILAIGFLIIKSMLQFQGKADEIKEIKEMLAKRDTSNLEETLNPKDFEELNSSLDGALESLKEKLQQDLDSIDDGIYRKVIVVEYLGKSRPIIVELEDESELNEDEKEIAFEKIIDDAFHGMVISATASKEE